MSAGSCELVPYATLMMPLGLGTAAYASLALAATLVPSSGSAMLRTSCFAATSQTSSVVSVSAVTVLPETSSLRTSARFESGSTLMSPELTSMMLMPRKVKSAMNDDDTARPLVEAPGTMNVRGDAGSPNHCTAVVPSSRTSATAYFVKPLTNSGCSVVAI